MKKKKIFISAGDISGDIHAAELVEKIKSKHNRIEISSVGGPSLSGNSHLMLANTLTVEGFGFDGLLKKYFYFRRVLKRRIAAHFQSRRPDLVILVDFYGFNIHVAALAKKFHIPVVYYISPQVWASREYRIKNIKKYVDEVICIFQFEKKIYEKHAVKAHYVGNPLVDIIGNSLDVKIKAQVDTKYKGSKLIGIFPGSRASEVESLLPVMLRIVNLSGARKRGRVIIFTTGFLGISLIEEICSREWPGERIDVIEGKSYNVRSKLWFCLASSGTVTVENAILGIPTIIMYKLSRFSYFIAKIVVNVQFIGMPNILAGKEILPEYVQAIDEKEVAGKVKTWMDNPQHIQDIKSALKDLRKNKIGQPGVIERAADLCTRFLA